MRGGFANFIVHNRKGTLLISTAHIKPTRWDSEPAAFQPTAIHQWLARRRITISLVGFTTLVLLNVFVMRTIPRNPLAITSLGSLVGSGLLLIGLAVRSWSAGTLNKSRELTMVGPYSLVSNPLYVGSFLMMMGFCVLCRDWPTMLFVAGPMSYLYWKQVRFEEDKLSRMFPLQWGDYIKSTPRFVPVRLNRAVLGGWSLFEWQRNREHQAIVASLLGVAGVWVWFALRTSV